MFLDVGEVGAELTAGFQVGVEDRTMFPEIAQSPLGPHADGRFFFGRSLEIRQEVIALLRVSAAHPSKRFSAS